MKYIKYQTKGNVAVIHVERPEALNALNSIVLEELEQVFDSISSDSIRCVVLTGAGEKAFVAGADIGEINCMDRGQGKAFVKKGNAVFRKIETLPIPVIAAVNGFALGGGCELALACDIRLAAEHAQFGFPEVSLGIIPGFGGTQRLARLIGTGKAKELLYTARKMKAAEALSCGLVNAVLAPDILMEAAMQMAEKIAGNAPIAVRAAKKSVDDGIQADIDTGIGIEIEQFLTCMETEDQKNAMNAFCFRVKPEPFVNR